MTICFFSHGSGTNQDGASLSMFNVSEELIKRGHRVIIVVSTDRNLDQWKNSGIEFRIIPSYDMRVNINQETKLTNSKFYIKNKLNKQIANKIYKQLKNENINIIHINGINNGNGALVANKLGIPYIWHIRQLMEDDLGQRLYNIKEVSKLMKSSASVIAISDAVKSKFEPEFGIPVKTIYNGVPFKNYLNKEHQIFTNKMVNIILPGRIVEGKGQMDAVQALNILKKRGYENIHLYLVGHFQTKYADLVMKEINNKNLNEQITILEHVSDLYELREKCDIGLLCSKKEAFGRVTIENQLAGLLTIGSNSGGTTELIDHRTNGLLYEQGNPSDLADQIEYALNNKVEMKNIAAAGRQIASESFSITKVVDQIETEYKKAVGDKSW